MGSGNHLAQAWTHTRVLALQVSDSILRLNPPNRKAFRDGMKKAFGGTCRERSEKQDIFQNKGRFCSFISNQTKGETLRRALVSVVAKTTGDELPAALGRVPTSPIPLCLHRAGGLQAAKPRPLGKAVGSPYTRQGLFVGKGGALHGEGGGLHREGGGISIGKVGAHYQEGGGLSIGKAGGSRSLPAGPLWSGVSSGRSGGMLHSSAFGGDPAPNECMQINGS